MLQHPLRDCSEHRPNKNRTSREDTCLAAGLDLCMLKSEPREDHEKVNIKDKCERCKNFWQLRLGSKTICQITPSLSTRAGIEILRELFIMGLEKEHLESIKSQG
eukprot:6205332-Alexandrium_andersonii.AAC.1